MGPEHHFEGEDVTRYEALLQMADLVVHHRDLPGLLPELAQRLGKVASFELASFSLYDPEKNVMRMHFWEGSGRLSDLTEIPVAESACGFVWEKQRPMIWPDLHQETRFQQAVNILIEKGVRSYCGRLRPDKSGSGRWDWAVPAPTLMATTTCVFCGESQNWWR